MSDPAVPPTSVAEHRAQSPKSVSCAVLTVSDTRTEADDRSGAFILENLRSAGHTIALYRIVKDEPSQITAFIAEARTRGDIQAILINGGTGIAPRDGTHEAIAALLEKKLDGFGELFRMLSYAEIGAAAMLSRAIAGIHGGMAIFSMPGSTPAVRLALEKLILPELPHVLRELSR